jgi:hypothetical protein
MKIFTKTLNIITAEKYNCIGLQQYELAAELRMIERDMIRMIQAGTIDLESFMKYINRQNYNDAAYVYLKPIERKIKLERINIILMPLVRRDKIRYIQNKIF